MDLLSEVHSLQLRWYLNFSPKQPPNVTAERETLRKTLDVLSKAARLLKKDPEYDFNLCLIALTHHSKVLLLLSQVEEKRTKKRMNNHR